MAFHRFQQLPAELRLLVWECAIHESLIDELTEGQKPVSRIVRPQSTSECPNPANKLVTLEDLTIGYVCRESREVFRRCGRLSNSCDYTPTTDVVYIDNYDTWVALDSSKLRQVRHIALSADFCYDMLKTQNPPLAAFNHLGCPFLEHRSSPRSYNSGFFDHALVCCPELESITIVLPPLEKDMPHYADQFDRAMRPAFLRTVSYSEIQKIRIAGPYSYTTCLRGSANAKRRCLGPFIKDVTEVWEKYVDRSLDDGDQRRGVTVQAGVFQYVEGPFEGKRRLSSIYKATEEVEEENEAVT